MVYTPGSAGQMDHQPAFGRDNPEPQLIRPPETSRLLQSYSPCSTPWHATHERHRAGPCLLAHTCAKGNRPSEKSGQEKVLWTTASNNFSRAQTLTFPTLLLKEWLQKPPSSLCLLKQSSPFPLWEAVCRTHTHSLKESSPEPRGLVQVFFFAKMVIKDLIFYLRVFCCYLQKNVFVKRHC